MRFLRESTSVDVVVGPLVDEADGLTPITSLTLADVTAAVVKGASRAAVTLVASGVHAFTHLGDGYWRLNLTSADTDTTGAFRVTLRDDDGFVPVWEDFVVLDGAVYDSLVSGTDSLSVTVLQSLDKTGYEIAGVKNRLDDLNDAAAAGIAGAVLDESVGAHQTAGSLGAEVRLAKAMVANKRRHTVSTGVDEVFDDDGTTLLRTMTPADGGPDVIDVNPS
jgi:hypothetical protein